MAPPTGKILKVIERRAFEGLLKSIGNKIRMMEFTRYPKRARQTTRTYDGKTLQKLYKTNYKKFMTSMFKHKKRR